MYIKTIIFSCGFEVVSWREQKRKLAQINLLPQKLKKNHAVAKLQ